MMKFDGLSDHEQWMLEITRKLTHLRSRNISLLYGDLFPLVVTDNIYAFARVFMGKAAIMVFNKASEMQTVEIELPDCLNQTGLEAQFGSDFSIVGNNLKISLAGNSFEIFTTKE